MSKMENYYGVLPQNFNDDLADSLMKAFSDLESVDVKDEIPTLQYELWQRGYLIAPRPEQIIESSIMWFVKVSREPIDNSTIVGKVYEEIQVFDRSVITSLEQLQAMLVKLLKTYPNLVFNFLPVENHEASTYVTINIEKSITIHCWRVK